MNVNKIFFKTWKSPVGELFLYASQTHLLALLLAKDKPDFLKYFTEAKICTEKSSVITETISQLKQYFAGERTSFSITTFAAGTEFQKKVWSELTRIPYGETISYKTQAQQIRAAKAVRAVGAANGKNPIAIIIPCHRVIGSNGKLIGYAGGQKMKSQLLKIEGLEIS